LCSRCSRLSIEAFPSSPRLPLRQPDRLNSCPCPQTCWRRSRASSRADVLVLEHLNDRIAAGDVTLFCSNRSARAERERELHEPLSRSMRGSVPGGFCRAVLSARRYWQRVTMGILNFILPQVQGGEHGCVDTVL
jgi:hypothetical protein